MMGCESGMGLSWELFGGVRRRERRDAKKMFFGRTCMTCVVNVHYFKDIRQGALQSDCV